MGKVKGKSESESKANEMENGKIERSTIFLKKKNQKKKELKTKEAIYIYINHYSTFNIQYLMKTRNKRCTKWN